MLAITSHSMENLRKDFKISLQRTLHNGVISIFSFLVIYKFFLRRKHFSEQTVEIILSKEESCDREDNINNICINEFTSVLHSS